MKDKNSRSAGEPLIAASQNLPELTIKVILFSVILAMILAAANAYLALKIGSTISASIPASVLAIGVLRFFKNSNVLESNIIQTAASGGEGVAAALAFALPAMILLRLWDHFPYWEVVLLTALSSVLGVFFSVPLRRVMLSLPTLRFPEGTAIGNVLKISAKPGQGLRLLVQGGIAGAVVNFAQNGLEVLGSSIQMWTTSGASVFGMGLGLTPAPLAAGYIVGSAGGVSFLVGLIGGWMIILPLIAIHIGHIPTVSAYDYVMQLWSSQLRFVGVGVMLVGGVWTLFRLLKPVVGGIIESMQVASQMKVSDHAALPRTERDFPMKLVIIGSAVIMVCLYFLVYHFVSTAGLLYSDLYLAFIAFISTIFIMVVGFVLSMICGYFTGLVGSTNNPISGILIIALIILGLLYMLMINPHASQGIGHVAGLMILVTTVMGAVATISNENLQDLKAGQIVGATPWKQQFILVIGVIAAAFVTGPVLELLFQAYGIGGVFPRAGMDPSHMLAAPQAGLMAAIAKGLRSHDLAWGVIGIGGIFAVVVILLDHFVARKLNFQIPVLAVGLGVYLPPAITTPIIVGAFTALFVKRYQKQRLNKTVDAEAAHHENGMLLCCGLVAGAALMGVFLSVPFVLMGSSDALAIMPNSFSGIANFLGLLAFILLVVWIYRVGTKGTNE